MTNKKYKLIENDYRWFGVGDRKIYRIVALRDFSDVKEGDLGGYIEKEENLSHDGNSWVYDDGRVYENARLEGNATVHNNAIIYGNAIITGNAKVSDRAIITDFVILKDNACAMKRCLVYGSSIIGGNSIVDGKSNIGGGVICSGDAHISENAKVIGNIKVSGNSHIHGNVTILMPSITICDADISLQSHITAFFGFGSRCSSAAVYRGMDGRPYVTCGCFKGTIDDFKKRICKVHGENQYAKEYQALVKAAMIHFGLTDEEMS